MAALDSSSSLSTASALVPLSFFSAPNPIHLRYDSTFFPSARLPACLPCGSLASRFPPPRLALNTRLTSFCPISPKPPTDTMTAQLASLTVGKPSSHLTTASTYQTPETLLPKSTSARSYRRQGGGSSEGEMEIEPEMVGDT